MDEAINLIPSFPLSQVEELIGRGPALLKTDAKSFSTLLTR
jgi:hypothetical protein